MLLHLWIWNFQVLSCLIMNTSGRGSFIYVPTFIVGILGLESVLEWRNLVNLSSNSEPNKKRSKRAAIRTLEFADKRENMFLAPAGTRHRTGIYKYLMNLNLLSLSNPPSYRPKGKLKNVLSAILVHAGAWSQTPEMPCGKQVCLSKPIPWIPGFQ
jgi:hypothetical protein